MDIQSKEEKIREKQNRMITDQTIINSQELLDHIIANSLPEKIIVCGKDVQYIYNKETQKKIDEINNFLEKYIEAVYS